MIDTSNEILIHQFYSAFAKGNYQVMQELYHNEAQFSDPVFHTLNSREVQAMWEMLLKSAKDLKIVYSDVKADGDHGSCRWEAFYTFSSTGRKVHNVIEAQFVFKDGKIFRHDDHFNFWRWSRMALGAAGLLLGWSDALKGKVSAQAKKRLTKFMQAEKIAL